MNACKSCGAEVQWVVTERGKRMPLNGLPMVTTGTRFTIHEGEDGTPRARTCRIDGEAGFTSHFATCRFAAQHRSK